MTANSLGKNAPPRFYQRFIGGVVQNHDWPRITTQLSGAQFQPRDAGLNFLIINAPIREWSQPNILPLGQSFVGAVSVMDGHRLHVLDLNAMRQRPIRDNPQAFTSWVLEKLTECLSSFRPDVIGIGGIITQYARIKRMTEQCKRIHPDIPIILGGGIATCMPEFMLRRLDIDIVVREEGELTISELLERIELAQPLDGIKGTLFKRYNGDGSFDIVDNGIRPQIGGRELGLDALPWPLRSRWPEEDVYKHNPIGHLNWQNKWKDGAATDAGSYSLAMLGSRGCPYAVNACDYCYTTYLGPKYRLRSPREVVNEMEALKSEYGVNYLHFLDDLLIANPKWAYELFDELKLRRRQTGFKIEWGGTCRTNIIAAEVLKARKSGAPSILERAYEVGMRQAGYGVETGSPTILKSIDKSGQTVDAIRVAIGETIRVFGYADCSFMIGSPGETRETVRETVELCKEIGLAPEVFFFTTAYPGTTFWQLALKKGLVAKAVTGKPGPADEDMIEEYCMRLGEQGDAVRTNFSDLPDEEIVELSWWAVKELGAQNVYRHPHTGDIEPERSPLVRGANDASL
ncbi:MAG: B12-binding domain-containing radical SAM protein [Alphaproteobacteria bacterium]|nr:B12-binding domain-containing radical SAM protein [Alphaproteobacteria bacterium]